MHLVVEPVTDVVLPVCEPVDSHPVSLEFAIVHSFACEVVAVVVDDSVLLGNLEVCCEVLGFLLVALGHDGCVCVDVWVEELCQIIWKQ